MQNNELTPKQLTKIRKQTRLRVQKYRQKKKELGYKSLLVNITPQNMEILQKYKDMKYLSSKEFSYSYIFNDLISTILKRRNTSLFHQRYTIKNIKKDKYDF